MNHPFLGASRVAFIRYPAEPAFVRCIWRGDDRIMHGHTISSAEAPLLFREGVDRWFTLQVSKAMDWIEGRDVAQSLIDDLCS